VSARDQARAISREELGVSPHDLMPPVRACCGKRHALPHQHVRIYQDKRGRTRHWYECAKCWRTLPERGLRPGNIRWQASPGSRYCSECEQAMDAALDAITVRTWQDKETQP